MVSRRTEQVQVKLLERELVAWTAAAEKDDVTLSAWIRALCNADIAQRAALAEQPKPATTTTQSIPATRKKGTR